MYTLESFTQPFPSLNEMILIHNHWLSPAQADSLYKKMLTMPWQEEEITLFGKKIKVPRRVFWMGDSDAYYTYANTRHAPIPWNHEILKIKKRIQHELGLEFNSVLGNLYRDGKDYMGWHSDNEPELGDNPSILSISLGAERRFCFKHKKSREKHEIQLTHGSALLMQGNSQQDYKHALPKSMRIKSPRINLTFRLINKRVTK